MNAFRLIKKEFKFLKDFGFRKKVFSKNTDYEVNYFRNNINIEISYYWGCLSNEVTKIDDLISNSTYVINVTISHNNKKENIFNCSLFDKNILEKLEAEINKIDIKNTEHILKTYSLFIKNHLTTLIEQSN